MSTGLVVAVVLESSLIVGYAAYRFWQVRSRTKAQIDNADEQNEGSVAQVRQRTRDQYANLPPPPRPAPAPAPMPRPRPPQQFYAPVPRQPPAPSYPPPGYAYPPQAPPPPRNLVYAT